jgi:hypothetical protein
VFVHVGLGRLLGMLRRMHCMSTGRMCMVCSFLVMSRLMAFRRFLMMPCRFGVVL